MKEVKEEVKDYVVYYEANDGTKFCNKQSCIEYEDTVKCVLRERLKKLIVAEGSEESLFGIGSPDYLTCALKLSTEKDVDTVMQLYMADNSWLNDCPASGEERKEKAFNIIKKAFDEKDILFVGFNCDNDMYILETKQFYIDKLNIIGKEEKQEQE